MVNFKKKNKGGGFFDPSQPLTSMIFKSLNYEFMCCILSGLKQICDKEIKRNKEPHDNSSLSDKVKLTTLGEKDFKE